jgi:hypothetical protein
VEVHLIIVKCRTDYQNPLMGPELRVTGEVEVAAYDHCLMLYVRSGDGQFASIQLSSDSADEVAGVLRTVSDLVRRQVAAEAASKKL